MKKVTNRKAENDSTIRREYDFTGGVRGKHFKALQAGYTVTIHKADGSKIIKEIKPSKEVISLEPDVQMYFPDSGSVNAALRSLIRLIPAKKKVAARKS
jgi:hypothetical protein